MASEIRKRIHTRVWIAQDAMKSREPRLNVHKIQKHFQNVMLVGMASEIMQQKLHTSVWIAQDTTESRVPRLNVHTNQILAHTFSHGTLDSVVS